MPRSALVPFFSFRRLKFEVPYLLFPEEPPHSTENSSPYITLKRNDFYFLGGGGGLE